MSQRKRTVRIIPVYGGYIVDPRDREVREPIVVVEPEPDAVPVPPPEQANGKSTQVEL